MLTPATVPSATTDLSPATASLRGLDGVNFFLAGALAGFGPYVAVFRNGRKRIDSRGAAPTGAVGNDSGTSISRLTLPLSREQQTNARRCLDVSF